jgi:hypothetical protein
LGRLPNSKFTPGVLPIMGFTGAFWGSGVQKFRRMVPILKIQITLFAFKIIAIHDNTLLATFIH